jgi:formylglycine-generating enzyme required for sulfatase activity
VVLAASAALSWSPLTEQYRRRVLSPALNGRDGLRYVWVPPGRFRMGCVPDDTTCDYDERPRHELSISRGFWMTQTEVTAAAYGRFTSASSIRMPPPPDFNPEWRDKSHPIVNVTWNEASAYCEWAGGRLPSEAEWEYAARGGLADLLYPWGNSINHENANYGGEKVGEGLSLGRDKWEFTAPGGSFQANGYALYDMAGNVMEWVKDWYADKYYSDTTPVDPRGPVTGPARIFRGGAWSSPARLLRASWRYAGEPGVKEKYIGFRCVSDEFPPSR